MVSDQLPAAGTAATCRCVLEPGTAHSPVCPGNQPTPDGTAARRDDLMTETGYRVPGAVWAGPSGVKIDPYDPAFTADTEPVGEPDKPAIYLFSNSPDGDGVAYAMAEDGTVLGSHFCSHWGYMRHDLHDRADRKERCEQHYPDGYRLVICGQGELPPAEVVERNRQQGEEARPRGGDNRNDHSE